MSDLEKLASARRKVADLEGQLKNFLSNQHSVKSSVIKKNPRYIDLAQQLRRAKAVVRSLERCRK